MVKMLPMSIRQNVELWNAVSMLPGYVISISLWDCRIIVMAYCIFCTCSAILHMVRWWGSERCRRWDNVALKMDVASQLVCCAVSCYYGAHMLMESIVIGIGGVGMVLYINSLPGLYAISAVSILTTSLGLGGAGVKSKTPVDTGTIMWLVTFTIFVMGKVLKIPESHILFHIFGHIAATLNAMNVKYCS